MDTDSYFIVLPEEIYLLRGDSGHLEEANIYFENIIHGYNSSLVVNVTCKYGAQYKRLWRLKTGGTEKENPESEFDLTVSVYDSLWHMITSKTVRIIMVERRNKNDLSVLCLGDSMTHRTHYSKHVCAQLENVRCVGTRQFEGSGVGVEGRGGWTLKKYFTETPFPSVDGPDFSPFMFPHSVSGSKFYGFADFWKNVVLRGEKLGMYKGFQNAARGFDKNSGFIYDESGYPSNPCNGDTVITENGLLMYCDGSWNNYSDSMEFSFSKYMERNGKAFVFEGREVPPDIVTIMFGANEFQLTDGISERIGTYVDRMKKVMESVRVYNAAAGFIIILPFTGGGQDAWAREVKCKGNEIRYKLNMQEAAMRLIEEFGGEANRKKGIFICASNAAIDPVYGFPTYSLPANKYCDTAVEMSGNWVHPNIEGFCQIGDVLAGCIQYMRNIK